MPDSQVFLKRKKKQKRQAAMPNTTKKLLKQVYQNGTSQLALAH